MLENYSDNLIILGTIGISLFSYYYYLNFIHNSTNIKVQKFKDFDYNIGPNIKLINKSGLSLKIIGGKDYNICNINEIINNNQESNNLNFKKLFLDLYNTKGEFKGNSFVSLIQGCEGIFLYDSNDNLLFNFNYKKSNFKDNKYVFEINSTNVYNIHKENTEKENNKKIQILS